jgi:hypothetical protein
VRKQIWVLVALGLALGAGCGGSAADQKAVRDCFAAYREAILSQRGNDAVERVNQATVDYYERVRGLALSAPEQEVRKLPLYDRMMVLLLRHRLPLDLLSGMNGREVFVYGVNRGWIGKEDVMESDVGTVRVSGDRATAQFVKAGKPTPLSYSFTKESGQWKMDLTAMAPAVNLALKQLIEREGVSEDEFLLDILESVSGQKPSARIWQPPAR